MTRWWGFEHECNGQKRRMGADLGWLRDMTTGRRRWVECIRCGDSIEFAPSNPVVYRWKR